MKIKLGLFLCFCLMGCVNTKFEAIKGKETDELVAMKGKPVSVLTEKGRQMWTYRQGTCTEVVFFDTNAQVDGFHEWGECALPE